MIEKAEAKASEAQTQAHEKANQDTAGRRPRVSTPATPSTSGGQPLPGNLRSRFEGSLGRDLSGVRVHTNSSANEAAESLDARAFTTGNDIFFNSGEYNPGSRSGQHLLGHEVAHTVQQDGAGAGVQTKRDVSQSGDASEVEADQAADKMIEGKPVTISTAPSAGIQRDGKDKSGGDDKKDGGLKIKKKPKWTGDSCTFEAFGKQTTISFKDGASAKVDLSSHKIDMLKPLKKRIDVPFAGVPGGIYLSASLSASASVGTGAEFTVKEVDWPGPWAEDVEPKGIVIYAQGSAKLSFNVTGTVGFGGFVGASFMNISAGGELSLAADASMGLALNGGGAVNPMGGVMGFASMTVNADAAITASGGITVDYMALIDSGNIFRHQLFKQDIAKAGVMVTAGSNLAKGGGGAMPPITKTTLEWMDWPDPGPYNQTFLRPPNKAELAEMQRLKDGASGSGGTGQDDMVEDDCADNQGAGGHYNDQCEPPPPPQNSGGGAGEMETEPEWDPDPTGPGDGGQHGQGAGGDGQGNGGHGGNGPGGGGVGGGGGA